MKDILLTDKERGLLKDAIESWLQLYNDRNSFYSGSKTIKRRREQLNTMLIDVQEREYLILQRQEIILLSGCVNQSRTRLVEELKLDKLISWLKLSECELDILNKIDCYTGILLKLNRNNNNYLYCNRLNVINKLKQSEIIFLSKVEEHEYRKIGFAFQNKEFFLFRLETEISFSDLNNYNTTSLKEFSDKFMIQTNRENARELFSNYDGTGINPVSLEIIRLLLN